MRGGRWAQLSQGTLGTEALGSLVLFWSNRRGFAVKQEAEGADRLPRGLLPIPPPAGRAAASAPALLCCAGASRQRCSPSSCRERRAAVLASKEKGPEEGFARAGKRCRRRPFADQPGHAFAEGVFGSAPPGSSPAPGAAAELSPAELSPAQPRCPLAPAGASLAPCARPCGDRQRT